MINKYGTKVTKPKGAIHKSTQIKNTISGLMRSDVLKYMMQLPLRDFAKKNPQFLEFVELTFGKNIDDFTVEMVVAYQNIASLVQNPNLKDFSYLQAELYGKVKEESIQPTLELPQMIDDSEVLNRIDTKTLEMLLAERKVSEAPKETFQKLDEFELVDINQL